MRTHPFRLAAGMALLAVCAAGVHCSNDAVPAAALPRPTSPDRRGERVQAAQDLTRAYAHSSYEKWHVRAQAAGPLCNVLVIQTSIILEDATIDAMHFGRGSYSIDGDNVQGFYRVKRFRGVIYRDGRNRSWTYGAINAADVEEIEPCS